MNLNDVKGKVAGRGNRRRIGRGPGSGWGQTAGRGDKGAQSRSGWSKKLHMDGGQMTFVRRIPKRGFTNAQFRRDWAFVNLSDLNAFEEGEVVTPEECLRRGIIPKVRSGVKILGSGTLEKKLTIKAHRASKSAKAAIEAADQLKVCVHRMSHRIAWRFRTLLTCYTSRRTPATTPIRKKKQPQR